MMTDRLYYDNAYLTDFEAIVVEASGDRAALDRSAFYPLSGGQLCDTGRLVWEGGEADVTDVTVENGVVWHKLSVMPPVGTKVKGKVDWEQRFEYMQQHAADHMIAGAAWQQLEGVTIGLHMGKEVSSIDMTLPGGRTRISPEELKQLEETVNERVQHCDPIRCWFPSTEELETLPLRKKPTVTEHIRIVAMGDYEMVACGGTHPRTTGEIGPVHIISCVPARGNMRVTFVAGMRAVKYLRKAADCAAKLCTALSADMDTAEESLRHERETRAESDKHLRVLLMEAAVEKVLASAVSVQGGKVCAAHIPFADRDILQRTAVRMISDDDTAVLLSCPQGEGRALVFARGKAFPADMAALLKASGARGGGKPDMAQGSAADGAAEQNAYEKLTGK